jgi:hypothetical protein
MENTNQQQHDKSRHVTIGDLLELGLIHAKPNAGAATGNAQYAPGTFADAAMSQLLESLYQSAQSAQIDRPPSDG